MPYGSDISGVVDVDFGLSVVEGERALVQAIARRYLQPRGGLRYARGHGLDLRNYLADTIPTAAAQGTIAAEARKDERVRSSSAVVTDVEVEGALERQVKVSITPRDSSAPFELTFLVTPASVSLLTGGV